MPIWTPKLGALIDFPRPFIIHSIIFDLATTSFKFFEVHSRATLTPKLDWQLAQDKL